MWHGSWAGAQQDEARTRWRDGNEEIWPPQRVPGHSHCHCHGNGQHQPSYLLPARPGLLQPQPILARPGTSIVCQGIQAYRTSTSGTGLHFVRSTITTATGWVASQQGHSASQRGRSQIRTLTGVAKAREICQVARLPGCRGDGVTGDALQSCVRPWSTCGRDKPITTRTGARASQSYGLDWNPAPSTPYM